MEVHLGKIQQGQVVVKKLSERVGFICFLGLFFFVIERKCCHSC